MLEMSVVASDKISGVVQNLSATCMSRLRWHNGVSWQPPEETRNPSLDRARYPDRDSQ